MHSLLSTGGRRMRILIAPVVSPCAVCIACGIFPALRTHGKIPPSELKLEDKRCAQEVEGFCSLRLRGQELRKRGFAGVATLIGLLIVGAVAYHSYGPRSRASTDVTSDRGSKRKAGNQPVSVITAQAEAEDFKIRRRTIGIMESPAIVVVRARIDSQVLEQHVSDGQIVHKGDPLFTLDDREIQALVARDQAQLAKDNAALAQTQADLGRKQELIEKRVAPQQQLDQAVAAYKAAQQTVEADEAVLQADRLKLGYAKLEAPITGRVGTIRVTPGNLVGVNDTAGLVTITQIKPIRAGFTLAERDLAALRKAFALSPPAEVRVYAPSEAKLLATGTLDFVDSSVDFSSGTIAAKAKFANDKLELWPGMYVDVEVDLDVRPNTVMIPAVAVQSGQKGPFVFVTNDGQTVEMRNVELAGGEGNRLAIAKGVQAGERVVVEGQMRLSNGARVRETAPEAAAAAKQNDKSAPAGAAQR
ncbi:MAG TPA: efflux RND transporter periplasmic adaptor subunit [Hyphomicrobiaceae bacterium]|nr:efflux RND transporter periplasmic adaptor subunit [Hyphomicrobiaceae bacterium]